MSSEIADVPGKRSIARWPDRPSVSRWTLVRATLLVLVAGTITIALQAYIGNATIYADELKARRTEFHAAIVANEPPRGGTWSEVGASTVNIRVGVVYLAEAVRRATGMAVDRIYIGLDTVFLFATLLLLPLYLGLFVDDPRLTLLGLLYFACVLPLTYFFHVFHPWDRPQMFLWIVMLAIIRTRRSFVSLLAVLTASIAVKFDSILLPLFYLAVNEPRGRWKAVVETAILASFAIGVFLLLRYALPAPNEPGRFTIPATLHRLSTNWQSFASMRLTYPPLLVFAVPAILALSGLHRRDRFVVASVMFAAVLSLVAFLTTVAIEVRAEMAILVLLMPAALLTLGELMPAASTSPAQPPRRP